MLTLTGDHLTVELAPERGAEIRAVRDRDGVNGLAYYDWAAPAPARPGNGYGSSELDWLSGYRGGWQETVPNAGDESSAGDITVPFHGEGSILEWTVISASAARCELEVALRLPLIVRRRMALHEDRATLQVETTVVNESDLDVPFVWGHHPVFPAVDGTRIDVGEASYATEPREAGDIASTGGTWPAAIDRSGAAVDLAIAPRFRTMRLLYLHRRVRNRAIVRQPAGLPSVAMCWDPDAYPVTWIWQMKDHPGFPWYGRMDVIAIEPQRAWPYDGLGGAIERGQAIRLGPRASVSSWLTMTLLGSGPGSPAEDEVLEVTRDGRVITAPAHEDTRDGRVTAAVRDADTRGEEIP